MPIEFRCNQCQKLLRVPDETAGRQAKCPACDAVLTIPETSVPPSSPFAPLPSASGSPEGTPFNPYQAPAMGSPSAGAEFAAAGPRVFQPTKIDALDVLSRTWEIYKTKLGLTLAIVIVGVVLQSAPQVVMNPLRFTLTAAGVPELLIAVLQIAFVLAFVVFNIWIGLGMKIALIKLARDQEASVADLFAGGRFLIRAIVALLLIFLMVLVALLPMFVPAVVAAVVAGPNSPAFPLLLMAGFALWFIPYIYILLTFGQCTYLIVDRDVGALESLSLSRAIVAGNRLHLIAVWVLGFLIYVAGFLACCVGAIFTLPLFTLAIAVTYLSLTGQPTLESYARSFAQAAMSPGTPPPAP